MTTPLSRKQRELLSKVYFERLTNQDKCRCSCGTEIKNIINTGCTPLINHIQSKHHENDELQKALKEAEVKVAEEKNVEQCDFIDETLIPSNDPNQTKITGFVKLGGPSKEAKNTFNWMRLIVHMNMPFNCIENPMFRDLLKGSHQLAPTTIKTVKKYMGIVSLLIEKKIKKVFEERGKNVGLVLDMWDDGAGTKELGFFLCCPHE